MLICNHTAGLRLVARKGTIEGGTGVSIKAPRLGIVQRLPRLIGERTQLGMVEGAELAGGIH